MRHALVLALVVLLCPWPAAAQDVGAPTMDETKVWLETEGRDLMKVVRRTSERGATVTIREEVAELSLTDCVLTWRTLDLTMRSWRGGVQVDQNPQTTDITVYLQEVNVGAIAVEEDVSDTPAFWVRIPIRKSPETMTTVVENFGPGRRVGAAGFPAGSREDGTRLATAIRHAAQLCRASSSIF